jgi:hypothetical protein
MSRFSGPQPGAKGKHGRTKGIMLAWKRKLQDEAEARNEITDPERRAAWRRVRVIEEEEK